MTDTATGGVVGMRLRPHVTAEQRRELRESMERLQRPDAALELAREFLPVNFEPATAECSLRSVHPDRFVLRLLVRSADAREHGFAIKIYSGDFGERMWTLARRIAKHERWSHHALCLPHGFLPRERALIFRWVDGERLSDIVDGRKLELLRRAAELVAKLHGSGEAQVPALTLEGVVKDTLERCARVLASWPPLESRILPLVRLLESAAEAVDPVRPTLIHGDLGAGQFLWTGDRLVLLDMDTLCLGDPAYDVGHMMGQLERRCVLDDSLPEHAKDWVRCFQEAYPVSALGVSARNVAFYRGVTLFRKMYTLCHRDPVAGPRRAARLAERARAALEAVLPCPEWRIA